MLRQQVFQLTSEPEGYPDAASGGRAMPGMQGRHTGMVGSGIISGKRNDPALVNVSVIHSYVGSRPIALGSPSDR